MAHAISYPGVDFPSATSLRKEHSGSLPAFGVTSASMRRRTGLGGGWEAEATASVTRPALQGDIWKHVWAGSQNNWHVKVSGLVSIHGDKPRSSGGAQVAAEAGSRLGGRWQEDPR